MNTFDLQANECKDISVTLTPLDFARFEDDFPKISPCTGEIIVTTNLELLEQIRVSLSGTLVDVRF